MGILVEVISVIASVEKDRGRRGRCAMQNLVLLCRVAWEEQLLVTKVQNKLEHVMDLVSLSLGLKRCLLAYY